MVLLIAAALGAPLTLETALERALEDNLELAQQRRGNAIVRYRLQGARAGFEPRLDLNVNVNQDKTPSNQAIDGNALVTTEGFSWSAGLSQELPTGGSVRLSMSEFQSSTDSQNALSSRFVSDRIDVSFDQPLLRGFGQGTLAELRDAHLDLAVQEVAWRSRVEEAVLQVAGAYWGLLSARGSEAIATRGVELAEQQLADTLERKEAGFAGSGDVLQVQVSLGQARRAAVTARADVGAAEARLARLLGQDLASGVELELTDRPTIPERLPSQDVLLAEAQVNNATVALARLEMERARRTARRARNAALPSLSVSGSAGWSAGGEVPAEVRAQLFREPAPSVGAGLRLGLPVLPRDTTSALGVARLQLEQAELALEAAEQDLLLTVGDAIRDVERDRSGLDAARQTLEHAAASLVAQRELLAEGRGSTRDVVDALEALRSAEAGELDALIALQRSVLRARRVGGTLVTAEQLEP